MFSLNSTLKFALAAAFGLAMLGPRESRGGSIVLHEKNNCRGPVVASYTDQRGQTVRVVPNDEARSMTLVNVRPGTRIWVYDSPSGSHSDDYTYIRVNRLRTKIHINTFQNELSSDPAYDMYYHIGNGTLDGKVSRIRIE